MAEPAKDVESSLLVTAIEGDDRDDEVKANTCTPTPQRQAGMASRAVLSLVVMSGFALLGLMGGRRPMSAAPRQEDDAAHADGEALISFSAGAGSCAGPKEVCGDSRCCQDGGSGGYQCYEKNEYWAVCLESCEKGVHKGETHGKWDMYGTFHPDEWSCEPLGNRSLPGCDSYAQDDCPETRCSLIDHSTTCTLGCQLQSSAKDCLGLSHCDWNGKCEKACTAFAKDECPEDRCFTSEANPDKCTRACSTFPAEEYCTADECSWKNGTCVPSCATYVREDSCPTDQCLWLDGKCKQGCDGLADYKACSTFPHCDWSDSCKQACATFPPDNCADQRCFLPETAPDTCTRSCSTYPEEKYCTSDVCGWKGDDCKPNCAQYAHKDSCPTDRCTWHGDACIKACWEFKDENSCDKTRCIFEGYCKVDPCSAPGEDCSETKCCSRQRGGVGKTCFKKNDDWATCLTTCESGVHEGDSGKWSCVALGNRTTFQVGCSWTGESCLDTHCCNNEGFTCARKDDLFTGCVQTQKKSTWVTQNVPIPGDWDGTVLGGGRSEYACTPSSPPNVQGTTLYCFMAILPNSAEGTLKELAKKNGASIYACDAHDIFMSRSTSSSAWDTATPTVVNTDVFIDIWNGLWNTSKFMKYDWTVKVDADCVFIPDRLRAHIRSLNPPKDTPIYLKNNGVDPGLGNHGFLGAIEVFSNTAVQTYLDNQAGCIKSFAGPSGEDGYFKGCMDALGICYMSDTNMFTPDYDPGACGNGLRAAFHPIKKPYDWQCCWDIILGKPRQHEYGHCL